jgi:hypothetical protein
MTVALVAGVVANKVGSGGAIWTRLSWALGLERLGFEVVFVEELAVGVDEDAAVSCLEEVASAFALDATLLRPDGSTARGRPLRELCELAAEAPLLLNISGHLTRQELLDRPATRVFLDLDPGWTQLWQAEGAARLCPHDHWFTVGAAIGTAGCALPTDVPWRPVRQPVLLDLWPALPSVTVERFTSVASWRGFGTMTVGEQVLGPKAHELRRFAPLPSAVPDATFELALDIHDHDHADRRRLEQAGWLLVDPSGAAHDAWSFRTYVQASPAEFSVAQGMYVRTRCGWFSDRSTRYLASGRPVLVQDTGFSADLPVGEGLVAFTTPQEAAAGARAIMSDHERHAKAARAIAEEHFASDIVIGRLCEEVDVAP